MRTKLTDGSGNCPEDNFQLGTDKIRVDISGSNHDIDNWADKLVSTQKMLEGKGFDHQEGVHGNINRFDTVKDYHEGARKRGIWKMGMHTPIMAGAFEGRAHRPRRK